MSNQHVSSIYSAHLPRCGSRNVVEIVSRAINFALTSAKCSSRASEVIARWSGRCPDMAPLPGCVPPAPVKTFITDSAYPPWLGLGFGGLGWGWDRSGADFCDDVFSAVGIYR